MVFDWIGKAITTIGAFLASDAFIFALLWLIVPYVVAWGALLRSHRPWSSPGWVLSPLIVALGAVALLAVLSPGQPLAVWRAWPQQLPLLLVLYAVLACAGPARLAWQTRSCVKRVRRIVTRPADGPQVFEGEPSPLGPPPAVVGTGRRIVIFCDGTSNRPDQLSEGIAAPTNVFRLFSNLEKSEAQTAWYDAGVGTETSSETLTGKTLGAIAKMIGWVKATPFFGAFVKFRTLIEAGFGVGITENIVQAYCEIVRRYQPGDRIYLIGFSRGAYTARCVAGVIRRCGLLRAENVRYSADVVRLFRMRRETDKNVPIHQSYVHAQLPPVEFLGLFDTVGSLGVPMWGWWFNALKFFRNTPLSTDPSPICVHVYHAMAMDERRAQFFPTPFDKTLPAGAWTTTLKEVWFRGAHCDVGGGYADPGLSDIALEWMLGACMAHGLVFQRGLQASLRPDPLARLHDELQRQPAWRLLGSWPRWHPAADSLHPSVTVRAKAIAGLGRHDMTWVGYQPESFTAGGQREWDRTGLILMGAGERYRLTWQSGEWRDEECPPCGPSGQPGSEFLRRLFRFRRRLPAENYMTLCITLAGPRAWPLREGGLMRLAHYLFIRDPLELRQQIAPVGRDLRNRGDSVVIQNNGEDCLLHLFANDAWMTAANNSGGLEMTLQRLTADEPAGGPVWTFASRRSGRRRGWIPANTEQWHWSRSA